MSGQASGHQDTPPRRLRVLPAIGSDVDAPCAVPSSELLRLLLVEKDEAMRDMLLKMLCPHFRVEAVADGLTACHAAKLDSPTLVLIDLYMPGTDSMTLIRAMRADARTVTIPVMVTSLQLTPFFRLGSVQLEALSNLVSLGLVAAHQAAGPLAAGISFRIEQTELDNEARLKSMLLKLLGEPREMVSPSSALQVDGVALADGGEGAPISVTTAGTDSTVVQLVGTFAISAMEFTPGFEIDSLQLELTSKTVRLRVAPSSQSLQEPLPPSFEIAAVQLGEGAQIKALRAVPSAPEPS